MESSAEQHPWAPIGTLPASTATDSEARCGCSSHPWVCPLSPRYRSRTRDCLRPPPLLVYLYFWWIFRTNPLGGLLPVPYTLMVCDHAHPCASSLCLPWYLPARTPACPLDIPDPAAHKLLLLSKCPARPRSHPENARCTRLPILLAPPRVSSNS